MKKIVGACVVMMVSSLALAGTVDTISDFDHLIPIEHDVSGHEAQTYECGWAQPPAESVDEKRLQSKPGALVSTYDASCLELRQIKHAI